MMPSCVTCGKLLTSKKAVACHKHQVRYPFSDETKQKIGKAHLGRKHSMEHREKLRIAHLGQRAWNKGRTGLPSSWNKGKEWSEESKHKMSLARLGREPANKGRGTPSEYLSAQGVSHRSIVERQIGRALKAGEIVHHWDEDKKNNEPSNLALLRHHAAHNRLHAFARRHSIPVLALKFSQPWLVATHT